MTRPVMFAELSTGGGMISRRNLEMQLAEPVPATLPLTKAGAGWCGLVSWLFAGKAVEETVATRVHLSTSPEAVWNYIKFFEEVPGRPPFLLRNLLPCPVRTEGDKTRVGAKVRCVYRSGDLVKRITSVEPARCLQFEVVEQRLGIEDCILALGGSYQIYTCGEAADVVLTTDYQAYLRPRYLWRRVEALLVSQLHRHILHNVGAEVLPRNPAVGESLAIECAASGDCACIAPPSRYRL
jgi:hypothetical protein